jgi:dTMP kinase
MIMQRPYPGFLISVEGIDGSGKTTLVQNLTQTLKQKNFVTLLTKEPGGTELGQSLRHILHTQKQSVCDMAEYLLFAADRAQHFQDIIIPELQAGTIIIADRLADSSLAYQGYGRKLDRSMIACINQWAMRDIAPDLTIYIRIDPVIALNRIHRRQEQLTSFEQEALEFWQRVNTGYEEIFAQRKNIITLDGTLSQIALCELAVNAVLEIL